MNITVMHSLKNVVHNKDPQVPKGHQNVSGHTQQGNRGIFQEYCHTVTVKSTWSTKSYYTPLINILYIIRVIKATIQRFKHHNITVVWRSYATL